MTQETKHISKGITIKVVPCDFTGIPLSLRKRMSFRLIVDGLDVTPKPLLFDVQEFPEEMGEQVPESTTPRVTEVLETASSTLNFTRGTPVEQISLQEPFTESELKRFSLFEESESSETPDKITPLPPSLSYLLQKQEPVTPEPLPQPSRICITLNETPTIFHLDLPTLNVDIKTEEGEEIESDNEYYDYITVGKGHHRNVKTSEIQTEYSIRKTRATLAPATESKDNFASANAWDLYHSYNSVD